MPRGPLPKPPGETRRRNEPTIPTTNLPAKGRSGAAPRPPKWMPLGEAGRAWWAWAWKTPQAAAWDPGCLVAVARRAKLEDLRAAMRATAGKADLAALIEADPEGAADLIAFWIGELKASAGGSLAVDKEADQLDDRLGMSPKARAALRWTITADTPNPQPSGVTPIDSARFRSLGA